jgi:RNA polymerase sigma factor (sigma-70 family)
MQETSIGDPNARSAANAVFATTHWSVVLSAQQNTPASTEALAKLCQAYWFPLYAYVRRSGRTPADAEDLTQGFFARLLEKDYLKTVLREKGRFRTFLLTALKAFMANEWDRQHARKRGGFAQVLSIDQQMAESRFESEPSHSLQPDVLYDRQWATTLLERTMSHLKEEYVSSGRAMLFEELQTCLARDEVRLTYADIAAELRLTEPAVKMAVHRLRGRYRELLREEIAQTVTSQEEVDQEIRHLFAAFGT